MDPEVKAKWLAALRSGQYRQAKHHLRNGNDGYCCLGVLCEIAVADEVIPAGALTGTETSLTGGLYSYGDGHETDVLPYEVAHWAGVEANGWLPGGRFLTALNDGDTYEGVDQHSFEQIADIIEQEL
jgi:hypothetical protein